MICTREENHLRLELSANTGMKECSISAVEIYCTARLPFYQEILEFEGKILLPYSWLSDGSTHIGTYLSKYPC